MKLHLSPKTLRFAALFALIALVAALPISARDISFEESCFPTCSTTDGRFLIIAAGTALSTLSDETLRLKFAVDAANLDPGDPKFQFEIFDGDSNRTDGDGMPHWDIGSQVPVLFELFAIATAADGTETVTAVAASKLTLEAGGPSNPFSSQITFDNDWFTVAVEVGPEALVANTGDYRYQLEIIRDPDTAFNPTTESLLNAFKIRTDESVFLSLLEQPFAFEAKWTNIADILPIFPNFFFTDPIQPAAVQGSTYDGSFTFYINVPTPLPAVPRTELTIFDGDLDHGNFNGTDPDTNDLDTCYAAETPACGPIVPLPFIPGPAVSPEGAISPAPFDDVNPAGGLFGLDRLNVRSPAVRYRILFPQNSDPGTITCRAGSATEGPLIEGRRSIINLNPSSDQEWEGFTLTVDGPSFPGAADCLVDLIPSGVYRVDLIGMDMNNLNAWFFGEDVCGLQPDRDPLCPEGLFLLGDTVWLDSDGDGNGDPAEIAADGESGIQGVIVRLIDGNGTAIGRTITDGNGNYNFTVGVGEFTVEVEPSNFLTAAGQPSGAVGDRVWLDGNGDGVQDPGEPGIPGVEVQLIDAGPDLTAGTVDDLVLDSTVTDRNGNYLFTGLPPANYFVNVIDATVPAGLSISGGTDPSAVYALAAGETYLKLDFGYTNTAAGTALVGDFVWHDLNDNGVQEANEPGISGVTVALFDVNVSLTIPVATVVTRGGFYLFTGVDPGDYQVEVTDANGVLAGYSLASGSVNPIGPFSVAVGNALLDKDFGYVNAGLNSIADRVWFDTDRNGLLDGAEVGIGGVTVTLIGDTGLPMATVTTAADGSFSFDGLPDGPYSLLITDLAGNLNGLIPTTAPALVGSKGVNLAGSDVNGINFGFVDRGALAGALATTASPTQTDQIVDANVLTYDFGYRFGSVGDRLWLDGNGNGFQDPGEPGINGVTVNLIDSLGNVVDSQVTSGDGNYTFTDVPADGYTVEVDPSTLPPGLIPTFDLDGIGTPDKASFPLAPGQDRTDVDFGYQVLCGLTVDKTCQVIPDPAPFDCGDAKPLDELTMIWGGNLTIDVQPWKGSVGSTPLPAISGVNMGDEISISGFAGSPNDVFWEIFNSSNGNKIGESKFHLSCSDDDMDGPEDCGLYQGNGKDNSSGFINDWRLEGLAGNGQVLDCNPVPPAPADQCEAIGEPLPSCETTGNPDVLTWRYTGGGCAASDNAQEPGKATCDESSPGIDPAVQVTVTPDGGPSFVVQPGHTFDISRDDSKEIELTQPGGRSELHEIHVSCSQPLQATDVYGSLTLEALDGQSGGTEVLYNYNVSNSGAPLANVVLTDVPLGPVGTIPSLPTGGSESFSLSAALLETTTNTVTATGVHVTGAQCEAGDSVTVTLTEPCFECDGGIVDMTLQYLGAAAANVTVYDDKDAKPSETLFSGLVPPGGEFFFTKRPGENKMDSNISVWIDNVRNAVIHTSCSQPIGPGQIAGDFQLVEVRSRNNGLICPLDTCNVDGSAGLELDGDKVEWEITNNGDLPVVITRVEISWPSENGDLVELKRDGDKYHDGDFAPTSAVIDSGFEGDEDKRRIEEGDTDTLTFKFDNDVILGDYSIRVEFDQGCAIEISLTGPASGGDFACDKPIDSLTMIWDGSPADIEVTAWKGPVGSLKLADQVPVALGGELTVSGYAGSPNDVFWEIFDAGSGNKIGESKYHLSCSDDDMDGPEDCGKRQGNGKDNSGSLINDWLLEGMVDSQTTLDCTGSG